MRRETSATLIVGLINMKPDKTESVVKSSIRTVAASIPGAASFVQLWDEIESNRQATQISEVEKSVLELQKQSRELAGSKHLGMSASAAEFMWRICDLGVMTGKHFKRIGYCTMVDADLAITCNEVLNSITQFARKNGGIEKVFCAIGYADYSIEFDSEWGGIAFIKVDPFDTSYWESISDAPKSHFLPIQSRVKVNPQVGIGEPVGILNRPEHTESLRIMQYPEFMGGYVAAAFKDSPLTFSMTMLTTMPTQIEYRGAPVFTGQRELVGVIRDTLVHKNEFGCRPIMSNFIGLKRFQKW